MRVLIPTYPRDAHAMEVALALEDRGHEAVQWHGSDFPTVQSASIEIGGEPGAEIETGGDLRLELRGPELEGGHPPFDVVWLRRPTPPVLPDNLHPGDRPVAQRECTDFVSGLYHLVAPDAFWVNPPGLRRAELKAVQLREAVRAGLTVPRTLMSNDPERIRRFVAEIDGPVVYKPFNPAQWDTAEQVAVLWTSDVTADDLPEDETLRLTPGIFQRRVPKSHELRVTVMGRHFVTARLHSQEVAGARLDWRAAGPRVRIEPDRLPPALEEGCLRLMRNLGIRFGCFDFVVTPEGEHVFLEVNPAGQFLWVEEANPEILLLAPFVDFLLSRDPDFHWPGRPDPVRHAGYYPRSVERIQATASVHVAPGDVFVSREEEDDEEEEAG